MAITIGDLVVRKSYKRDLVFRVVGFDQGEVLLKGIDLRLMADAPPEDLEKVEKDQLHLYRSEALALEKESIRLIHQNRRLREGIHHFEHAYHYRDAAVHFEYPGNVLHIDGDKSYLDKCLKHYAELGVPAVGFYVSEKEIPKVLPDFMNEIQPDILVITGHDGILKKKEDLTKLDAYRNSRHFVEAVKQARRYERDKDALVVIAGACQSHFEALIQAGANFASSPQRKMIHALDPVFIAERIAHTSFRETLNVMDVLKQTVTGIEGIGGLESRGKLRLGLPKTGDVANHYGAFPDGARCSAVCNNSPG